MRAGVDLAEEAENSEEGFRPRIDDEKGAGIEICAGIADGMLIRALAEPAGAKAATIPMWKVMAMTGGCPPCSRNCQRCPE
jgi:hypothetical protein